jgi:MoaA/NifB/PqqE/SkfB family radical SAM enzyme
MLDTETDWTPDAKPLMFLDLKLGNICNLKCRICGSWSSSTFATEELANLGPDEDRKTNHHYQMLRAGAWPRENSQFWQEITQVSDQIQYIEFTGGEPFMIQEHFDLLQGLVDRDLAGGIEIHYNTNGTQYPESAADIWRHFRHVEIAFSIDDVGARFEYQRSGAVWTEVQHNIARFQQLRTVLPNISLQVCSTVNVFNVLYLPELAVWNYAQGFDYVYWNMMHEAYYFSISTLPEEAKSAITMKLRTSGSVSDAAQAEFERIVAFMTAGVSLDGQLLRMKIADLDRKRGQDLRVVEPEFAALINYSGPHG